MKAEDFDWSSIKVSSDDYSSWKDRDPSDVWMQMLKGSFDTEGYMDIKRQPDREELYHEMKEQVARMASVSPIADLANNLFGVYARQNPGVSMYITEGFSGSAENLYGNHNQLKEMNDRVLGVIVGHQTSSRQEGDCYEFCIRGGRDVLFLGTPSLLTNRNSYQFFDGIADYIPVGSDIRVQIEIKEMRERTWQKYSTSAYSRTAHLRVSGLRMYLGNMCLEAIVDKKGQWEESGSFGEHDAIINQSHGLRLHPTVMSRVNSPSERLMFSSYRGEGIHVQIVRSKALSDIMEDAHAIEMTDVEKMVAEMGGLDRDLWIDNPKTKRIMAFIPQVKSQKEIVEKCHRELPTFKI